MDRYVSQKAPRRIISQAETLSRLGNIRRTAFKDNLVKTGRLKPIHITKRRVGFLESDVEKLIEDLARARG